MGYKNKSFDCLVEEYFREEYPVSLNIPDRSNDGVVMMRKHPTLPRAIHFIQYLFPRGKPQDQWVVREKDIYEMAKSLWENGWELNAEVRNGMVWLSAIKGDDAIDKHCDNGPSVGENVDSLIREAFEYMQKSER